MIKDIVILNYCIEITVSFPEHAQKNFRKRVFSSVFCVILPSSGNIASYTERQLKVVREECLEKTAL